MRKELTDVSMLLLLPGGQWPSEYFWYLADMDFRMGSPEFGDPLGHSSSFGCESQLHGSDLSRSLPCILTSLSIWWMLLWWFAFNRYQEDKLLNHLCMVRAHRSFPLVSRFQRLVSWCRICPDESECKIFVQDVFPRRRSPSRCLSPPSHQTRKALVKRG